MATDKDMFNSLKYQVGGSHYSRLKIQPAEYSIENCLLFPEGNVIKYTSRHDYWKHTKLSFKQLNAAKLKGKQSVKKAIQYLEMILERDYDEV
ncbi:Protein of unknwon function (DUF3310) [uncultured Mediterranean phage uvMED]|jgi:hypothetical protein|nr:hypothetical protein [uncultured Mediterranean phage uvMED]BAQ85715.1 Protein of unknwon function (DUF3310) [uncultured Mediterranean phage uvMED]BAR16077.1 hypothetical protein [uncultured Mediterranean phage uvMED]BAR16156.1 hypothetical protein [uncultured Mediterranean phage uvMED]